MPSANVSSGRFVTGSCKVRPAFRLMSARLRSARGVPMARPNTLTERFGSSASRQTIWSATA